MNNPIKSSDVFYQPAEVPADLHIWQDENSRTAALVNAARDIVDGKTFRFALCDRVGTQIPTIAEIVTIAMGSGDDGARYCGENNDPEGPGSSALIASYYSYRRDPAGIGIQMALAFLCSHHYYFRLANV